MLALSAVTSDALRAVVAVAVAEGNDVATVAQWEKSLVVHMKRPLSEGLAARVRTEHPGLTYYRHAGDPHNPADRGFTDGQFSVSFPIAG
ncbi:MAG: hypothetical protein J7515_01440 [Caulobacter sp.]|nr:hypothetical protein [Caulobacter sp.]